MQTYSIHISRIKRGKHKKLRCHSLRNYSVDIYEEALGRLDFPNYRNFGVIDLLVPIKLKRIKQNSQEWFDGEVGEKISVRVKLFKKFKKSKLHID